MMSEQNRNGEVWVFAEQDNGKLHDVVLELCGRARELADRLGVKVAAVLPGYKAEHLAPILYQHGVDRVYLIDDPRLELFTSLPYAETVIRLIQKHRPQIVLYGATPLGRDMAPRIASATRSGLTADCTDLQISDVTDAKTKEAWKDLLLQIRREHQRHDRQPVRLAADGDRPRRGYADETGRSFPHRRADPRGLRPDRLVFRREGP